MLKAVLFDFDGTIVDSLKHHLYAYHQAYNHFNKKLTDEEIVRDAFYTSVEVKTSLHGVEDKEKFSELYFTHLDEAYKSLETQENLVEVLDFLKKKDLKLAIITLAPRKRTAGHLKGVDLDKYFDLVLGGEDVEHRKPHPEIAEKAMKICKARPEETLLVGDTDFDIETGKKAKVMTALFTSEANLAYIHPDFYGKVRADFEFKDFSELPEKISRLL